MRGRVLPAVLLLVAVGCGAGAVWSGRERAGSEPGQAPSAPVLSPRRAPALMARLVADGHLRSSLDRLVASPELGPARNRTCLVVRSPDARSLYELQPGLPLIPASNMKLLTAAVALDRLGPSSRYTTQVRAPVPPSGGVVAGDLWLVGGGDPLLATADYAATAGYLGGPRLATPLEALADRIVSSGVRQVQGRLLGDESRYDTQRYVPSWNPGYITDHEVGPLSALTVNGGFASWRPRPVVPATAPAAHAAGVLAGLLQARGVTVAGTGEGKASPGAPVVASVESPPMSEVVAEMLRESDNLTAELVVKELGARFGAGGSTTAGLQVIRSSAAARGLPVAGLAASDGSGLDRADRGTCELFSALLDQAGERSPLAAGLPLAGREGTLTRRFVGTPAAGRVRAKTGSLDHVVSLSGWATTEEGRSVLFSLVANDLPRDSIGFGLQDKVVTVLVRYPDGPSPSELAPGARGQGRP